jgi:hypothetical protein
MSLTLYEIDDRLQQALDAVTMDEETGELHGMEAVELLELELGSKLLAIGKYCKALDAEETAINEERLRLTNRAITIYKKRCRLTDLIQSHLNPDQEIKDSQCVLKLRKCAPSVRILDEKLLAPGFMRTTTTTVPDKKSIAEVLKNGNEVPGAELVTNYSLQIR